MADPSPLPPIEYRSPPFGSAVGAVVGFTLYVVALALLIAFVLYAVPRASTTVIVGLALLAAMVVFSIYADARWRWRGVLAGMLIGIGLTLLIPGICFVMVLAS